MKRRSNRRTNFILDAEQVSQIAVEALRPEVKSILHADQVDRNANPVCRAPDRTLQNSFHAQFPPDLSGIAPLTLEAKYHTARRDSQPVDPRQHADQFVGQSFAEVLVLGIRRLVHEWHYSHR